MAEQGRPLRILVVDDEPPEEKEEKSIEEEGGEATVLWMWTVLLAIFITIAIVAVVLWMRHQKKKEVEHTEAVEAGGHSLPDPTAYGTDTSPGPVPFPVQTDPTVAPTQPGPAAPPVQQAYGLPGRRTPSVAKLRCALAVVALERAFGNKIKSGLDSGKSLSAKAGRMLAGQLSRRPRDFGTDARLIAALAAEACGSSQPDAGALRQTILRNAISHRTAGQQSQIVEADAQGSRVKADVRGAVEDELARDAGERDVEVEEVVIGPEVSLLLGALGSAGEPACLGVWIVMNRRIAFVADR